MKKAIAIYGYILVFKGSLFVVKTLGVFADIIYSSDCRGGILNGYKKSWYFSKTT